MSTRMILGFGLVVLTALPMAAADPVQVNISGATLFANFFSKEASTNDFINVDNDQAWADTTYCDYADCHWVPFAGFLSCPCDYISYVDQLAASFDPPGSCNLPASAWWLVNYRGVGSGNGLAELRSWVLSGAIPQVPPSDYGYLNRAKYSELGACLGVAGCSGLAPNCTPLAWVQTSIDLAVMDVPTTWFVTEPGTAAWNRKPLEAGYGLNPQTSWDPDHQSNKLKSLCDPNNAGNCLNLDLASPDDRTVFDTPIAWVPVAPIANRGAIQADNACPPHQSIKESELKYLFLTGRMPTGENLIVAARDSGSGTRNAWSNSLGIDPSWGRGDNYGILFNNGKYTLLGPHFRASNCGGSGEMEDVVKNQRLAIGYTGLAGTSRAVGDVVAGKYEILGVTFDTRGGTQDVRPTIHHVLYNCDPNTGYQIGGNETFATVGDPFETDPNAPAYMANQAAAGYLQNMIDSIAATESSPGGSDSYFMPGELLAKDYFLQPALSCLPDPLNPTSFQPNPGVNTNLRQWSEAHNGLGIGGDCPGFGQYTNLYPAPVRAKDSDYTLPDFNPPGLVWPKPTDPGYNTCDCSYPPDHYYSDGTGGVSYKTISGVNVPTSGLAQANWLAGDFNQDGVRDINDIPAMMAAIYDRYVLNPLWNGSDPNSVTPNGSGQGYPWTTYKAQVPTAPNTLSLDIIGDLNGDGNFDCRDVRYFCDGLALVAGDNCGLHRWDAFVAVDNAWFALTGDNNFFNTTIFDTQGNARPWVVGASAADVAGGGWVAPGAAPAGYDCRVDCEDAVYIKANFGVWADLDDAVAIDLSCDLTNDRQVGSADLQRIESLMGGVCPSPNQACLGDLNCDGTINFGDINPFVQFVSNYAAWQAAHAGCNPLNGDINCDGTYGQASFGDINPFVALMTQCGTGCPCPGPVSCP
jgi:hypothetical protein